MLETLHNVVAGTYSFLSDGSYTYEESRTWGGQCATWNTYGYTSVIGMSGTWEFSGETLVLVETMTWYKWGGKITSKKKSSFVKRLRVYVLSTGEIGLQFATKPDLLNFKRSKDQAQRESIAVYGVHTPPKRISVGYDKYGCEIDRRFCPQTDYFSVYFVSPMEYRRVDGAQSPSPPRRNPPRAQPPPVPRNPSNPHYDIINCKRESNRDFAYQFKLRLKGDGNNTLQAFRGIQKEFRDAVKKDYAESFPGVKWESLYVDFPEYELDNGTITGRAVVLTISITSLVYDPNTRTGRLAVRVKANQYEEARAWIRKNIETLARDKNIALTSGVIPPAARFYLGREELKDGNILEIEFKTE